MMLLFAIIAGFILDLLIGDPRWLPHPICLIGNLISFLEKLLRSIFGKSSRGLLVGGAVLVILVLAFSFCVPFLVLALAASSDLFNWKFDKLFRKAATQYFWKKLAWLIGRRRCISNISACFFVLCSIFSISFGRKNQSVVGFCCREFYVLSNFCNALFT